MSTKPRKKKRKPKQATTPKPSKQATVPKPDEICVHTPVETPVVPAVETPFEIEVEIEESASAFEVPVEGERSSGAAETPTETANPATVVDIRPPDAEKKETTETLGSVEKQGFVEKQAPALAPVEADSESPNRVDRRAHPRYPFVAPVEVVAAETSARLKTRVRDLSQQGCYVDTENPLPLGTSAEVRITKGVKSFEARARVVYNQPGKGMGLMFTAVEPIHHLTLDIWIGESRETSWLAANRRRSQRVLMKIPVRISGKTGLTPFKEDTHTLTVSAHGASLVVERPVTRGQRFTLLNLKTRETLECVVAHIGTFPGEPAQVGVEFMLPNPTFWRVNFPPKDWNPRHPDAKKN
jgi:PilZ domain